MALEAAPHAINGLRYITLYRDASHWRPYGARWKAMFVSEPGALTGIPIRIAAARGGLASPEGEWRTMQQAVRAICGSTFGPRFPHGYITRAYLPRYEGRKEWRWVSLHELDPR